MSEVTTGSVSLSLIGAPIAVATACLGSVYFAGKYCADQYDKMLLEIEKGNERLKWLDKQVVSSPMQMAEEAKRLQKMVSAHSAFLKMTEGMSKAKKEILAGAIATEHSPLKGYVPKLMNELPEGDSTFETALKKGTRNLALDNFRFVNSVVKDAAAATGFIGDFKILKQTDTLLDIVFSEKENPVKKFTAYLKIDRQLNPSLALDLEGFGCDTNECTMKMDEIIKYLQSHGVPFSYSRLKHNQPMGILRKMLDKKEKMKEEVGDYLKGNGNSVNDYLKQK